MGQPEFVTALREGVDLINSAPDDAKAEVALSFRKTLDRCVAKNGLAAMNAESKRAYEEMVGVLDRVLGACRP